MVESIAGEEPMKALFMLENPDWLTDWGRSASGFVGCSEVGRGGGDNGLGTASNDELVDHTFIYIVFSF